MSQTNAINRSPKPSHTGPLCWELTDICHISNVSLTEDPFFRLLAIPPNLNFRVEVFLPLPFFFASLDFDFFLTPGPEKKNKKKYKYKSNNDNSITTDLKDL